MNILIAADYATPASGNFVASCIELGLTLKNRGDNLFFIFPENSNTTSSASQVNWLRSQRFHVYLVKKELTSSDALIFLKSVIQKHNIDILHIHFGLFHSIATRHARELDVKILVHDHMDFAAGNNLTKQKIRCALRSIHYRLNHIAIASVNPQKDSAYFFAKHWYIPNGLSLIRNVPKTATRDEVRYALGIDEGKKICLFLGWDVHRKGLDIAVKAVNEARKTDPGILLGIVGMGDPPNKNRLRFIFETTGIDPSSPWIKYFPSQEDMFAYHRAVDVYLSASRSEAFSYGILEAISENTPLVVSDIKGTSWCHRYSKSVVYPTEDYNACAGAILHALSMGRTESNASGIVAAYSIDKWCDQMIDIYNTL